MDNLDKINYKKHVAPDWFIKIDLVAGTKTDFTEKNNPELFHEMQTWLEIPENEIEPVLTPEEQAAQAQKEFDAAKTNMVSERNKRILEADKWELPSVMQRFDLTVTQILEYKQVLLDITESHTTLEQFLNPEWPEKLVAQELL